MPPVVAGSTDTDPFCILPAEINPLVTSFSEASSYILVRPLFGLPTNLIDMSLNAWT